MLEIKPQITISIEGKLWSLPTYILSKFSLLYFVSGKYFLKNIYSLIISYMITVYLDHICPPTTPASPPALPGPLSNIPIQISWFFFLFLISHWVQLVLLVCIWYRVTSTGQWLASCEPHHWRKRTPSLSDYQCSPRPSGLLSRSPLCAGWLDLVQILIWLS